MLDLGVSYHNLTRLLERRGFTLTRVKGSHHLFTHAESGTTIMLPDDSSARPAMPVQVAAVRKVLDERGLMSREDFEARVRANGSATEAADCRPRGRRPKVGRAT